MVSDRSNIQHSMRLMVLELFRSHEGARSSYLLGSFNLGLLYITTESDVVEWLCLGGCSTSSTCYPDAPS